MRQARTQSWETVWKAKANRLRTTRTLARVFLAVAEVVFEVVAVGFEDVESLVLDLPSGAAACGEFGDGVGSDGQIGDDLFSCQPVAAAIQAAGGNFILTL